MENTSDHVHNERDEEKARYNLEAYMEQMEKRRIRRELKELTRKYAEMEKWLGGSPSVQN